MEPTEKTVTLPVHLWRALDDMSKDGAQQADVLVRHAVEQFVALQGYELPAAKQPAPAPAPKAAAPEPKPAPAPTPAAPPKAPPAKPAPATVKAAPVQAAPLPVAKPAGKEAKTEALERGFPPVGVAKPSGAEAKTAALEPHGSVTEPVPKQKLRPASTSTPSSAAVPQSYDEEDDMGEGMTRVRMGPTPGSPTDAGLGEVPVVTDTRAAHEPSQSMGTEDSTVHGESGGPEWVKRAAALDTDSDRTAARERMQAIDSDLVRLTLERPTTAPLREPGDAEE